MPNEPLDLDAKDLDALEDMANAGGFVVGRGMLRALIARVREQEREIARLNELVKQWEQWGDRSDGGYSRNWDGLDFGGCGTPNRAP